jgi:hypothetical protein
VCNGKPENLDHWEIPLDVFEEIGVISGALGNAVNTRMPADADEVIPETVILTSGEGGRPKLSRTTRKACNTMQLH